jgi:hypothetical protein
MFNASQKDPIGVAIESGDPAAAAEAFRTIDTQVARLHNRSGRRRIAFFCNPVISKASNARGLNTLGQFGTG